MSPHTPYRCPVIANAASKFREQCVIADGIVNAFQVVWHDFQSDAGSADYGTELDASLTWRAAKSLVFGLKLADYQADDLATDTTKAWFWLAYSP